MSLAKRDIARAIHAAVPEISISEAVAIVDAIFTAVKDRLARGEKVMITNFGTFQVVQRAPRQGINPATGGGLIIEGHHAITFRPSPALQQLLNPSELPPASDLDPAGDR